ncbi:MAG: hypothetical protein ACI8Q9_002153, partial [Planctomycetota bacterium]
SLADKGGPLRNFGRSLAAPKRPCLLVTFPIGN